MTFSPRNTAKTDPLLHLLDGMDAQRRTGDASNMILEQEATGQLELVNSEVLPTDMGHSEHDTKVILEAAGVKFLGVVEGDDMFQRVELPDGWKKVATSHSMHSNLVDDKGRKRAGIFYKAAFYDRSAHMHLTTRFSTRRDYDRQDAEGVAVAYVMDGDEVVHTTDPIKLPDEKREQYGVARQADEAAAKWLNDNYPDWRNPAAYWD